MSDLHPERPAAAGMPEEEPDSGPGVEAARTLANQARDRLEREGFDDEQLRLWADTFVAEGGSGDVDDFVAWIRARQR